MTAICGVAWDSTTPAAIPGWARLRLLYGNGRYAQPLSYGKGRMYIDVTGAAPLACGILDVERYDASPATAPGWLDARARAGMGLSTIYVNRSNLAAVQQACGRRSYWLIVATLDGTIIESVTGGGMLAACQALPASMLGGNVDEDLVVSSIWWNQHAA